MKKMILVICFLFLTGLPAVCAGAAEEENTMVYTRDTSIREVQNDPVFGSYGRLIFPADSGYMSGDTLGSMRLTWYNNIDQTDQSSGK